VALCRFESHRQNLSECFHCCAPGFQVDFNGICREVFDFHDQIIDLYQTLVGKAEIPEVKELMESLLTMEQNESKRLASQIGRMDDL